MIFKITDKNLVDEGVYSKKEIQSMRKKNPKGCIYHGLTKFSDCYHCDK